MKASLTLVSNSAPAGLDPDLINDNASDQDQSADKKHPHLRLVSPEVQADLLREATLLRKKRKPKKKKQNDEAAKKPIGKTAAKKSAEKKAKKPKSSLTETVDAPSQQDNGLTEATLMTAHVEAMISAKRSAVVSLVGALQSHANRLSEQQSDAYSLLNAEENSAAVIDGSLEAIPLLTDIIQYGDEQELQSLIDLAINEIESLEASAAIDDEEANPDTNEIYAFNAIGKMFISQEVDPFGKNEWVIFQQKVYSKWYDTRKEASDAIHHFLVEAKLNFACETKIVERPFYVRDYAYKRYAFSAFVGIYFEEQPHEDLKLCREQCVEVNDYIVPLAKMAMRDAIRKHRDEREGQLVPGSVLTDKALDWTSVGLAIFLAYSVVMYTINTGVFGS